MIAEEDIFHQQWGTQVYIFKDPDDEMYSSVICFNLISMTFVWIESYENPHGYEWVIFCKRVSSPSTLIPQSLLIEH